MERFVSIIDEKCNRCAKCVSVCPMHIFRSGPKGYVYVTGWSRCDGCGSCIEACGERAIDTGEMIPSFTEKSICFFEKPGPVGTRKVCELVAVRVKEGIRHVVVASCSGTSALIMAECLRDLNAKLIVFTLPPVWSDMWPYPSIPSDTKQMLESMGAKIMDGADPVIECGPESIDSQYYESKFKIPSQGIWELLHGIGGQGFTTAVEAVFTAVKEGKVTVGSQVIGAAGTGCGLDTAIVMKATPYEQMLSGPIENRFDILEIIAVPKKKLRYW